MITNNKALTEKQIELREKLREETKGGSYVVTVYEFALYHANKAGAFSVDAKDLIALALAPQPQPQLSEEQEARQSKVLAIGEHLISTVTAMFGCDRITILNDAPVMRLAREVIQSDEWEKRLSVQSAPAAAPEQPEGEFKATHYHATQAFLVQLLRIVDEAGLDMAYYRTATSEPINAPHEVFLGAYRPIEPEPSVIHTVPTEELLDRLCASVQGTCHHRHSMEEMVADSKDRRIIQDEILRRASPKPEAAAPAPAVDPQPAPVVQSGLGEGLYSKHSNEQILALLERHTLNTGLHIDSKDERINALEHVRILRNELLKRLADNVAPAPVVDERRFFLDDARRWLDPTQEVSISLAHLGIRFQDSKGGVSGVHKFKDIFAWVEHAPTATPEADAALRDELIEFAKTELERYSLDEFTGDKFTNWTHSAHKGSKEFDLISRLKEALRPAPAPTPADEATNAIKAYAGGDCDCLLSVAEKIAKGEWTVVPADSAAVAGQQKGEDS